MDITKQDLLDIPCIYQGLYCTIYRQDQNSFGTPVIIKVLRYNSDLYPINARFDNEYHILKDISFPGMRPTYDKITIDGRPALIQKYIDGENLSSLFVKKKRTLQEILEISISILESLCNIHYRNIIHQNIDSTNIIVDSQTMSATIIDFGNSTKDGLKSRNFENPELSGKPLHYISPEQTGRVNRMVDHRTDLYSFGIVLYEMLAGKLPFDADNTPELFHCHIAMNPTALHIIDPEIPATLSDIVSKLLNKNPDDRYQSAWGLKIDLEHCLALLNKIGFIDRFKLSSQDFSFKFNISDKFCGREQELQILLDSLERVENGTEIILISGETGAGKTSLVNQFKKLAADKISYFITGKYNEFQINKPYHGLQQALNKLIDHILTESNSSLIQWKEKILNSVGSNGALLIDILPRLELIIGKQPPAQALNPAETQIRFIHLLLSFMKEITIQSLPCVIFLDNIQWVDMATVDIGKQSSLDYNNQRLLLIFAYRDNELRQSQYLTELIEASQESNANTQFIRLENLSSNQINNLISDTLNCTLDYSKSLTELVYEKTGGNALFTIQFLQSLHEENLLSFNADIKKWCWNPVQIREKAITENIVSLMTQKITKLSDNVSMLLSMGACIGNTFDIDFLAEVASQPVEEVFNLLWQAVEEGLLIPINIHCNFPRKDQREVTSQFEFLHNKVQQVAYELIPKKQQHLIHLKIGRLRISNKFIDQHENFIFDITDQYNKGFRYINDEIEKLILADLNLRAGRKAKREAAPQTAIWYLSMGIGLLPSDKWKCSHNLTLNLYMEAMEAEYLSTNFERAEFLSSEILQHIDDLLIKIKVYESIILFHTTQNQNTEAIKTGRKVLDLLHFCLPDKPSDIKQYTENIENKLDVAIENVEIINSFPFMNDEFQLAIMRILMNLTAPAHQVNPELVPVIILKMVDISVNHGNSPMSAFAYGWYAVLLCTKKRDIYRGYQFGYLSLKVLNQFANPELEVKVNYLFNTFVRHWNEHARESLKPLKQFVRQGIETGDLEYAYYGAMHYCGYLFFTGNSLTDTYQCLSEFLEMMDRYRLGFHGSFFRILGQTILNLIENSDDPCQLNGLLLNEKDMLPVWTRQNHHVLLFFIYCCRTMLQYMFGNYLSAIKSAILAEEYISGGEGYLYLAEYYYYYALALLAHYSEVNSENKAKYLKKVIIIQEKIKLWAQNAPVNFKHKYDLIEAEKAKVSGDTYKAMEYYNHSIKGAIESGYIQEEALAYEREAIFYLSWGRDDFADLDIKKASDCYKSWGAVQKVDDLDKRYKHIFILDRPASIDTAAIIKASHMVSSEIRLEQLLNKIIHIVIENAGAEKGILIQIRKNNLFIQAKGEIGSDKVETMQEILVEKGLLALSVVNYVARTSTSVVLNNAFQDVTFSSDEYISEHKVKSLLCLPIIHQGKLTGLLYLENNLATNVFTHNRIELLKALSSQAAISIENAILYANLEKNIFELHQAEDALAIRMRYEKELSVCSQLLLQDTASSLTEGMRCLLNAANASRIYIFENQKDPKDGLCMRQIYEVCADGISQQINNPSLQYLPYKNGFQKWEETLRSGKPVVAMVSDLTVPERKMLEPQDIISILAVPIWISGLWYGFIGFYNTKNARKWTELDINLLQTAAGIFGNYIERKRTEDELQKYRKGLEVLVKSRTLELTEINEQLKREIHERNHVEKSLLVSEERYRNLAENAPIAIVVHTEGKIAYVNPEGLKIMGAESNKDLIGKSIIDHIYCDSDMDSTSRLNIFNNSNNPGKLVEEKFIRLDDTIIDVEVASAAVDYLGNTSSQIVFRDITERKHSEEKIRSLNQKLERNIVELTTVNKEMEAFSYSVSHDLQAPLRAIDGFCHILIEDHSPDLDSEGIRVLNTISNNVQKMRQLINDLLTFSRLGRREMSCTTINMEEMVLAAFNEVKANEINHINKIQFKIHPMTNVPGDSSMIRQVIVNLISNAIKFSRTKETIIIECGCKVEINENIYYIKDNGVGFNMLYSNKLFEVFQRLHCADQFEGTGVGLALVQRIIHRHGGRVWGESEENKGAIFYFSLPILNETAK